MRNLEKKQIDMVKESICVYEKYKECRTLFKAGALCFADIEEFVDDKGKSCLYRLKEVCHALYRNSETVDYRESLYHMTVGYIFHEAMKIRENLYQVEHYRPNLNKNGERFTEIEKKVYREIVTLSRKADKRLKEGLKEVRTLLNELVVQMKGLLRLYRNNYLLPRFLFENERGFTALYGKKGFESLLEDLYSDGRIALMEKAAKSYLKSEYFDIARVLFQKIHKKHPENKEAQFLYMFSSANHFYLKNMLKRAERFIGDANALAMEKSDLRPYYDALKRISDEIGEETKKRIKTK